MEDTLQQVVAANNRFGFKLLDSLSQKELKTNIIFSPFSIAMCLTLVANGAANETQHEMLTVLDQELDLDAINQANRELMIRFDVEKTVGEVPVKSRRTVDEIHKEMDLLRSDGRDHTSQLIELRREILDPYWHKQRVKNHFQLTIANALWTQIGTDLEPQMRVKGQDYYKARVSALNFADWNSVNVINSWVKSATQNTIRQLVSSIARDTVFIAANAIYFKAKWTNQFLKSSTRLQKFTLLNGDKVDRHMMYQPGHFNYWEDDDIQMIKLPYNAAENDVAMYVILPKQIEQLKHLLRRLDLAQCESLINRANLQSLYGEIVLPQFNTEYDWNLIKDLQGLGMIRAFHPLQADFSQLCTIPPRIWLDLVQHKAFIKVDEEGTEAAAATMVRAHRGYGGPRPIFDFHMIVDHPFIYLIRENETGSILFMGVTLDPRK
jgi:serpin B